jgi:DNA-binding response OmpR family regulator
VKRVLLVSDDQVIIDRTAAMLEDFGCEVYVATTELLASTSCAAMNPDTVVVDIEMRGGRGFESLSAIRRLGTEVLLIAVTRGDHKEIWPRVAEACGAAKYIAGPVSASKLVNAITSNDTPH